MENDKPGSIKIKDNRRFDADGNERREGANAVTSKAKEDHKLKVQEAEPAADRATEDTITFSSFVMSLATQALMQLGQMPPPKGLDIQVDREAARQTIDILSLIQNKTKGNLDVSESRLMEEILHNLRMAYIQVSK